MQDKNTSVVKSKQYRNAVIYKVTQNLLDSFFSDIFKLYETGFVVLQNASLSNLFKFVITLKLMDTFVDNLHSIKIKHL